MEKRISEHVTDEFVEAITNFSSGYVSSIKSALFAHACEIADDSLLRCLLLEYNRRLNRYKTVSAKIAQDIIHGAVLPQSAFDDSCLNHYRSYADVLDDMLRHMGFFELPDHHS